MNNKDFFEEINQWIGDRITEFDDILKSIAIDETEEEKVEEPVVQRQPRTTTPVSPKWEGAITPKQALDELGKSYPDDRPDWQKAWGAAEEQAMQQAAAEKYSRQIEERIAQIRAAEAGLTPGHKVLTDEQTLLIGKVRHLEESFTALVGMVKAAGGDGRRVSIATTDAEKAFMMLVKSITA